MCEADVINELGYPSHKMLARWHKDLQQEMESGIIRDRFDRYSNLRPSDQGTVDFVDDTGTIFCIWDSGSTLGVVYGEDAVKRL